MESEVLKVKERYKSVTNNNRRGSISTYISSNPNDSIIKQSTQQTAKENVVEKLKVLQKPSIFDMHPDLTYNSKSSQFLIPNDEHFRVDRVDDSRTQNISLNRNESMNSSFSHVKGSHNMASQLENKRPKTCMGTASKRKGAQKPGWLNPNSNNKQSEVNLQRKSKTRIQKMLDDPLGKLKEAKTPSGYSHHHHHHHHKKVLSIEEMLDLKEAQ